MRKFSFPSNTVKDWNGLTDVVAAAPTLESFRSHFPNSLPSEQAPAPPVSRVDDGYLELCWLGFASGDCYLTQIGLVGDMKSQWNIQNSMGFFSSFFPAVQPITVT